MAWNKRLLFCSSGPIGQCCYGVRSLDAAARRFACGCLKSAAASVTGLNLATAAKIPARCAVNIPPISASVDCSRYVINNACDARLL